MNQPSVLHSGIFVRSLLSKCDTLLDRHSSSALISYAFLVYYTGSGRIDIAALIRVGTH